jgi:transcriptional regulator with PAS, ATPase and Fis domain
MIIEEKIVFSNKKFNTLASCAANEVLGLTFDDIFSDKWSVVISQFDDPEKSITFESQIVCSKRKTDVVLSLSKVKYGDQHGFIVIVKDVSKQKGIEKATQDLSQELQTKPDADESTYQALY